MKTLYNISIKAYSLGVKLASINNAKAKKWVEGRKDVWDILESKIDRTQEYVWFHCASLGEFEQGRPVIEQLKQKYPQYKVVLSFFSPSGYEVRKNYEHADIICYIPEDSKANAKRFLDLVQPKQAFFVKYEFWYHFISELNNRDIPTYIFSAIFRPSQLFFKSYGKWFAKMLHCYKHLFVQNELSKDLLHNVGINNVTVSGDTRFDRVYQIASSANKLPIVEQFAGECRVVVAGSSWGPDEDLLIDYINNKSDNNTKWIFAPHEVSEESVNAIIDRLEKKAVRYSQLTETDDTSEASVLIVDGYGYLTSVYSYGTIAYVGGGFGVGIHNILEAATFGMPIIIGPNHEKFQEARDLKKAGAVFSITNQTEIDKVLSSLLTNKELLENTSQIAQEYVKEKTGATQQIIDFVCR